MTKIVTILVLTACLYILYVPAEQEVVITQEII